MTPLSLLAGRTVHTECTDQNKHSITKVQEGCKSCNLKINSEKLKLLRTSDSLNEGLPIKMTREKFQRK